MKKIVDKLKETLNHRGFRKYFFNTSWIFAERVLRIINGLFVGVCVARYLGPERLGIFSFASAFVALFGVFAKLGLDSITVRELVNHPEERDSFLGTVFWLKVMGALLILVMLGVAVQFFSNDPMTNLYIFIIASSLIFQAFEVIDFYFQAKVRSRYVSICRLIQLSFSSLLKLCFVFIKADLLFFVLVTLVDEISLAASLVFAYWKQGLGMFFRYFKLKIAKSLLRDSWPLILSGIAIMIYMRIDQIMIKEMLNASAVGLYSAAVKLAEAWYFIPVVITSSLFPAIVNAKSKSEQLYHERLQRLYDLMMVLAFMVALPATLFSAHLVTFLYGEAFRGTADVLTIYVWAGIFVALGVASNKWLLSENLQTISAKNTIIGAVMNVGLNYLLIPRLGTKGAAIATVISYSFAGYAMFLFHRNTRKCFVMLSSSLNPFSLVKRFVGAWAAEEG